MFYFIMCKKTWRKYINRLGSNYTSVTPNNFSSSHFYVFLKSYLMNMYDLTCAFFLYKGLQKKK